jgi:hypothetical protein
VTQDRTSLRRERDVGAIIGDSFSLLIGHFGAFAAIVFPAMITSLAFSLLALAMESVVAIILILIVSLIVEFVVFEIVRSAGVVYLDQLDRRDEIPSAESLDRAQARIGVIGGAAIRASLITAGFAVTLIGIPWAIMRIVRWAFLSQVIMLEDKRGEDVLATSAELVRSFWWITFGRLILTGLVIGLPTLLVSGVADAIVSPLAGTFVDAALVFVTVPYGIISTTLMYFDLKTRKARHDSISTA